MSSDPGLSNVSALVLGQERQLPRQEVGGWLEAGSQGAERTPGGFELTLTCGWDLKVELSALSPSPLLSPLKSLWLLLLVQILRFPLSS